MDNLHSDGIFFNSAHMIDDFSISISDDVLHGRALRDGVIISPRSIWYPECRSLEPYHPIFTGYGGGGNFRLLAHRILRF